MDSVLQFQDLFTVLQAEYIGLPSPKWAYKFYATKAGNEVTSALSKRLYLGLRLQIKPRSGMRVKLFIPPHTSCVCLSDLLGEEKGSSWILIEIVVLKIRGVWQ